VVLFTKSERHRLAQIDGHWKWGRSVSEDQEPESAFNDSDQLLSAAPRRARSGRRLPHLSKTWALAGAALFVAFLVVPAFMANTVTTSPAGSLATSSVSHRWVLPPSQLVTQFGTGFSLDTNSVAPIASSIGTPGEIFHSIGDDAINIAITIVIILFIAFPANIFNQTLSENYAEIQLMKKNAWKKVRKTLGLPEEKAAGTAPTSETTTPAGPVDTTTEMPGLASRRWFIGTLAIGAIFGGFLDPNFGFNGHSVESFVSTMLAFAIGAVLSWFIAKTFRQMHKYPTNTYLKALPIGLAVAFGCVIVSRLTHFEPGYLYGVVVSISFVASMKDQHNNHLIVISTASTLSVALIAWMFWIPINHLALEGGGNFIETILDDVLGSIFIGGLIGSVIGLLPLEGLPGGSLVKWRRDVWVGVFFVALFLLISVELRPSSGPTHPGGAPIFTAIVLFLAFGALSFGARAYFKQRKLQHKPDTPA
jgi:hypothetical protein